MPAGEWPFRSTTWTALSRCCNGGAVMTRSAGRLVRRPTGMRVNIWTGAGTVSSLPARSRRLPTDRYQQIGHLYSPSVDATSVRGRIITRPDADAISASAGSYVEVAVWRKENPDMTRQNSLIPAA